jgi:phytoene synthase
LTLSESQAYCVGVSRRRAKNFYYSFLVLPEAKRLAICAVYAFMRECDDRSDAAAASAEAIAEWREQMDLALDGTIPSHPVWPAFADAVQRYSIPRAYLYDMLDGVNSDLNFEQPLQFEDLYRYCYRVAGVVGLTITHIFGFQHARALEMAEKCGIAFQFTNILRDVAEDASLGRVYLPREWMQKFHVDSQQLSSPITSAALRALLKQLGQRAEEYYQFARPLVSLVDRDSRPGLWALMEIYGRLFRRIQRSNFSVLERRHRLPTWEKLAVLAQASFRV